VDTTPECDVPVRLASKIESIGIIEDLRIAVCRSDDWQDHLAPPNVIITDCDLFCCHLPDSLNWRAVPKKLLDSTFGQILILAQACQLLRIPQQRENGAAD